ncbi:hypothetical protein B0T10DRAFT_563334 [Thelonectria olida]|uniref:Uncharacterized protein n=1 Tax=Thelonectria olida TaxID=1576542 RepID=A0A9P8W0R4_9HYPO|nr:hypothetical protein B0T10DRAFT_563334 [Thelonectria olida]
MFVENCEELIMCRLQEEFGVGGDSSITIINPEVEAILESSTVALVAQTRSGQPVQVNMMMPRIRAWLKRLAAQGVGYEDDYGDVRFMFTPVDEDGDASLEFARL